ncbi:MAG: HAD-IB family hydrolase [Solirubrobacterales bacterium]|nr:HAD-IB family hydrolase [Solirubrobacterales bacterium]
MTERPAADPPAADAKRSTSAAGRPAVDPPAADAKRSTSAAGIEGREAAFFDLDRTLIAGSSGLPWARAAAKAGLIGRGQMLRWGLDALRFRLRGATDEATEKLLSEVKAVFQGTSARQLERLAPEVLVGLLPRIYPEMLAEVYAHQDAGRPTFIVSAAGDELVQLLARILYMDGGIGTRYEIGDDGLFTGELGGAFMYGEGKVEAMRRFADDHGIDLDASFAYSDSASDLPMLRAVGQPVVVNPDDGLARIARERGWRVMRFEKLGRRLALAAFSVVLVGLGILGRHRIGGWTSESSRSRASRVRRS